MALFQAHPKGTSCGAQPEGLGLFLRPVALSLAHVAGLHHAHSALLDAKTVPAGRIGLVLTGPKRSMHNSERIQALFNQSIQTKVDSLAQLSPEIGSAADLIISRILNGNKILSCGSGGTTAMAQHFSAEMLNRFERERPALPAIARPGEGGRGRQDAAPHRGRGAHGQSARPRWSCRCRRRPRSAGESG